MANVYEQLNYIYDNAVFSTEADRKHIYEPIPERLAFLRDINPQNYIRLRTETFNNIVKTVKNWNNEKPIEFTQDIKENIFDKGLMPLPMKNTGLDFDAFSKYKNCRKIPNNIQGLFYRNIKIKSDKGARSGGARIVFTMFHRLQRDIRSLTFLFLLYYIHDKDEHMWPSDAEFTTIKHDLAAKIKEHNLTERGGYYHVII